MKETWIERINTVILQLLQRGARITTYVNMIIRMLY